MARRGEKRAEKKGQASPHAPSILCAPRAGWRRMRKNARQETGIINRQMHDAIDPASLPRSPKSISSHTARHMNLRHGISLWTQCSKFLVRGLPKCEFQRVAESTEYRVQNTQNRHRRRTPNPQLSTWQLCTKTSTRDLGDDI